MGKLMEIPNSKLKAGTLVEVLVSLTIITFLFSISLVIYLNIFKSENNEIKLKAAQAINTAIQTPNLIENNEFVTDEITVDITQTPYLNSNNLILMEYAASDNQVNLILTVRTIDIVEHEN